jgi:hypothetical protein
VLVLGLSRRWRRWWWWWLYALVPNKENHQVGSLTEWADSKPLLGDHQNAGSVMKPLLDRFYDNALVGQVPWAAVSWKCFSSVERRSSASWGMPWPVTKLKDLYSDTLSVVRNCYLVLQDWSNYLCFTNRGVWSGNLVTGPCPRSYFSGFCSLHILCYALHILI